MKVKKGGKVKLPIAIRNELRMLCAMRGYSIMKGGKGKTLMQHHDSLFAFYHGKPPSRPSQINMLAKGSYCYSELYECNQRVATSKKDDTDRITELVLKKELHRDASRRFRATKEINIG